MMAPFQDYVENNSELIAEGQKSDGQWEKIVIAPYLPFSRGETAIRLRLSSFRGDEKQKRYTYMAQRILELESQNGRQFSAVRLLWENWPKSQYSFYENHTDDQVNRYDIATYNLP
jgi:hypothetical protein